MTATPKIYSPQAEAEAERDGTEIYGMNKEEWFGKQLFLIRFSDAVKQGLLVDYKAGARLGTAIDRNVLHNQHCRTCGQVSSDRS